MAWGRKLLNQLAGGAPAAAPVPRVVGRADSFPMEAVGENNYQEALGRICGGHTRDGHDYRVTAFLVPEPANRYDPNAVRVLIDGHLVGYLAREQATRVAGRLRDLGLSERGVTCAATIRGGWRTNQHDAGHFGVKLGVPTRGVITVEGVA